VAERKDGSLERLIASVRRDQDVVAVILFGSEARGDTHARSDVDVCLVLWPTSARTTSYPRKRLAYLDGSSLDVQIFQQLPLYLRSRVLRDGRVLYCRDENALYEIAFHTVREFEDYRHIHEDYLEAVARG
jgi:predicted nucleotidyltransferase